MTNNDAIRGDGNALAPVQSRLARFRQWATEEAHITVNDAVGVVSGDANYGTRDAPIEPARVSATEEEACRGGSDGGSAFGGGGCGGGSASCDGGVTGYEVRALSELYKGQVAISIPTSAMVTPDLIEASDAGRAVRDCCGDPPGLAGDFWDAFGPTDMLEYVRMQASKQRSGAHILDKMLSQRKRAEEAIEEAERIARNNIDSEEREQVELPAQRSVSRRAPYLAFLIHQRFANEESPPVVEWGAMLTLPEGTPSTFAPYAKALPSTVRSPICWERKELELIAGCIPGLPTLRRAAARTAQLAAELIALVEAGLLWRFPSVFRPGMITWDRWVWAAAVYESRVMSASSLPSGIWPEPASPGRIRENHGVLIPLFDVNNHNDSTAEVDLMASGDGASARRLNVVVTGKAQKHMQISRNCGAQDNESLLLRHGVTHLGNPADKVRIAWSLADAVGGAAPPADYVPVWGHDGIPASRLVFGSSDGSLKGWWTDHRLRLLAKVATNDIVDSLTKGGKITFSVHNNGKIDSMLLAVAIVATIPQEKVAGMFNRRTVNSALSKPLCGLTLDETSHVTVRLYLSYLFSTKLLRILQSLESCLKGHFSDSFRVIKEWRDFFDKYVIQAEDCSCLTAQVRSILTLYDGYVMSLKSSLDVMATDEIFTETMTQQLQDMGCTLGYAATLPATTVTQPRSYACDHCGAIEKGDEKFSVCTGCRNVYYCDESCQRSAWTSHQNRCQKLSSQLKTLELHYEKLLDFDSALNYASKHMSNLKHVMLTLTEHHDGKVGVRSSAGAMLTFLKANKGKLDTFSRWAERADLCFECTKEKTNGGQIWTELHGLKTLRLCCPVFSQSKDLFTVIAQQELSIMSLNLQDMTLGNSPSSVWSRKDTASLAKAISRCKHLVRLGLNGHQLRDSDVEDMLPHLKSLRILLLGVINGEKSYLSDRSCKSISRNCSFLQRLDLHHQTKITLSGLRRVLKSCQELRLVRTSAVSTPSEAISAVSMAPKLVGLGISGCFFTDDQLCEIIVATGGKTVVDLSSSNSDLYAEDLPSEELKTKYARARRLLRKSWKDFYDPNIINEWSFLA